MFRPAKTSFAPRAPLAVQRRRRARKMCAGTLAAAGILYLASPYTMLWSMGAALRAHDNAALRASLDWEKVRAGLKDSLGFNHASLQTVSQQDELPGFGDSFATGVASGMIDEDITPQRLDAMLSTPSLRAHGPRNLPHGFFAGPSRFEAEIPVTGQERINITMRIEKWRWKVTRITVPDAMLAPTPVTRVAARS